MEWLLQSLVHCSGFKGVQTTDALDSAVLQPGAKIGSLRSHMCCKLT